MTISLGLLLGKPPSDPIWEHDSLDPEESEGPLLAFSTIVVFWHIAYWRKGQEAKHLMHPVFILGITFTFLERCLSSRVLSLKNLFPQVFLGFLLSWQWFMLRASHFPSGNWLVLFLDRLLHFHLVVLPWSPGWQEVALLYHLQLILTALSEAWGPLYGELSLRDYELVYELV